MARVTKKREDVPQDPSRRTIMAAGAAALAASLIPRSAQATDASAPSLPSAAAKASAPPGGYNILFVLVDEEHFFPKWPFPVPAREWMKKNGITFLNHQTASCVCSSARSTLYTGKHIQHSGVFDNLNQLWQPDMSTQVDTIGQRLQKVGYYAAYQGKWHLSANLDQTGNPADAPLADYQKIIESYGFKDFLGFGDLIDSALGGYTYDDGTTSSAISWMRTRGVDLKQAGQPWFLAVNLLNPHDVMYTNSDLPGQDVQGKSHTTKIARPPRNGIYEAEWNDVPLPSTRHQPFDAPGRPKAQKIYQEVIDVMLGQWPDEDRRWRLFQNYWFNCIRDCDRQVQRLLESLAANGFAKDTIVVFNADHGELDGSHQMRDKGNSTYWRQNHIPLMIHHPAYPGGRECAAITSQIDLAPTLLGLTGAPEASRKAAGAGLKGRDFSGWLARPGQAKVDSLRPASLFNFNMLSYQDARWSRKVLPYLGKAKVPVEVKDRYLVENPPDFDNRCAIRSIFDGRHRFSRYFSPVQFNTPGTLEELLAKNDLEVYDLRNDPEETRNLALDPKRNGALLLALNDLANRMIAEEVGEDDGSFLPIRNGRWHMPEPDKR
jgi:arylsulfatase A-like enzyme